MNCIEKCKHGAISYKYHPFGKPAAGKADSEQINETRRSFFTATALVAATSVLKAQEKKVDGGLAAIEDKKIPERSTPLTPPGSLSARNMAQHCTACQLCVSACPNQVLRPSADLRKLMQPEMSRLTLAKINRDAASAFPDHPEYIVIIAVCISHRRDIGRRRHFLDKNSSGGLPHSLMQGYVFLHVLLLRIMEKEKA